MPPAGAGALAPPLGWVSWFCTAAWRLRRMRRCGRRHDAKSATKFSHTLASGELSFTAFCVQYHCCKIPNALRLTSFMVRVPLQHAHLESLYTMTSDGIATN